MRNTTGAGRDSWAAFVRSSREAVGLSQTALAQRMGINRNTIGRWESGQFGPDKADDVVALARATGRDPDDALIAAGFRPAERSWTPEPPIDPDVRIILRRLADPSVSRQEKLLIRAQLRYLVELAEREHQER